MKVKHNTLLILATLLWAEAPLAIGPEDASLRGACQAISLDYKKCKQHADLFEVPIAFMHACAKTFSDSQLKQSCFKSGADLNTLNLCKGMGWNQDNTSTCLRTLITANIAKLCKDFSSREDDQISCLRMGRDASQVAACKEWSDDADEKISCLKMDIPASEIRNCKRNQSNLADAKKCLRKYVGAREKQVESDNKYALQEAREHIRLQAELDNQAKQRGIASKESKKSK